MASFMFGVNPFSTPVGQRIERATDGGLASEDWALNIEICDIINETDEGPKDASRAIRKRLQGNKNWKSVLLTLTVLETCVKNCGRRFHTCISTKDFMGEMTKILSPKNNPPQIVQDKILSLIQSWADAFRGHPDLSAVVQIYENMKSQGMEFPAQDLDTLAPIYTPERPRQPSPSSPSTQPPAPEFPSLVQGQQSPIGYPAHQPPTGYPAHQPPTGYPAQQPPTGYPAQQPPTGYPAQQPPVGYPPPQQMGPVQPNPEQLAKLRSQLDIVEQNVNVMSEMLTEMTPGQEQPDELQLLQELNRTCRAMQTRVMELLDNVANEEVMSECLRINDDLNNVFIRYDRFERYREAAKQQTTPSAVAAQHDTNQIPIERGEEGLSLESQPQNSELIKFFDSEIPEQEAKPNNCDLAQRLAGVELKDVTWLPTNTPTNDDFLLHSVAQNDEFDMFAQSRKTTFEDSRRNGSTYGDNIEAQPEASLASAMYGRNPNPSSTPTSTVSTKAQDTSSGDDFLHVEQWLTTSDLNKPEAKETAANTNPQESMSSSEFEKFLSERAAAGEKQSNTGRSSSQRPPHRQMQMTEVEEDLFGL